MSQTVISLSDGGNVLPKDLHRIRETQAQRRAIGSAIRALRADAQLSQATLAERSRLSTSWISRLESGKHEPTFESMRSLARGLGVSMAKLAKDIEVLEQS